MPLSRKYPILYDLSLDQNGSVPDVAAAGWVIRFRIRLPPMLREMWYELAAHLNTIEMNGESDRPLWKWTKSKKFSVKSIYNHITRMDNGNAYKSIWKTKIPEKVRIFMWLVAQKSILTKENMIKRNWGGDRVLFLKRA
jgi:hypothetical protein